MVPFSLLFHCPAQDYHGGTYVDGTVRL